MSNTLIGLIKVMTGDPIKFRYDGSIFPWRGKSGTIIPVWACIDILHKEGWSNFRWIPTIRCWRATRPDGANVDMAVNTMRWLTIGAVYENERERQQNLLDNPQPV
jgi:hypothetical protein